MRQLGFFLGFSIESGEIHLEAQHPTDFICQFAGFSFCQFFVRFEADAAGRFTDLELQHLVRLQTDDVFQDVLVFGIIEGSHLVPAVRADGVVQVKRLVSGENEFHILILAQMCHVIPAQFWNMGKKFVILTKCNLRVTI